MGTLKKVGEIQISWKAFTTAVVVLLAVAGGVFALVKVQDKKTEQEYQNVLAKLHGLLDIEGELEDHKPRVSRDRMHEIIGRQPDQTGPFGKRLVDVYEFDGPLNRYRLSLRFEKNADHVWMLNNAKSYWVPGRIVRPHKDPLD